MYTIHTYMYHTQKSTKYEIFTKYTNQSIVVHMKIHFACSTSELAIYSKNYVDICNLIRDAGHIITRDWIDNAVAFNLGSDVLEYLDHDILAPRISKENENWGADGRDFG